MRKMSIKESKATEAAIRDVFEQGCAAWNRGDLDGYLAGYWDSDRTRWISGGSVIRGKEAIATAYKSRFAMPRQMGRIAVANLEIDVLTPTDAFVFGRWTLVTDQGSARGFFTVQLKKIEGAWLFVSDHASSGG